MDLYFLRHGLAGQHGDPQYKDDSLRPLTVQGQKKIRLACIGMQVMGLKFDAILSSPYLRARQTAEIVASRYTIKNKKIHFTTNLLPPATHQKLIHEILAVFPKSKNVLLVGHEPHLSAMISCFLGSEQPLPIDFKKGGLCCLSIIKPKDRSSAVLNWLLTPTQLGLIDG